MKTERNTLYSIQIDRYCLGMIPNNEWMIESGQYLECDEIIERVNEELERLLSGMDTRYSEENLRRGRYERIKTYENDLLRIGMLYERRRESLCNEPYIKNIGSIQFTCKNKKDYRPYNREVKRIEKGIKELKWVVMRPMIVEVAMDIYNREIGAEIARMVIPRYWRGFRPEDTKISVKGQYFGKKTSQKKTHCYSKDEIGGYRIEIILTSATARRWISSMTEALRKKEEIIFGSIELWDVDLSKLRKYYGTQRWYRDMRKRNVPTSSILETVVRETVQKRYSVKKKFFRQQDIKAVLDSFV